MYPSDNAIIVNRPDAAKFPGGGLTLGPRFPLGPRFVVIDLWVFAPRNPPWGRLKRRCARGSNMGTTNFFEEFLLRVAYDGARSWDATQEILAQSGHQGPRTSPKREGRSKVRPPGEGRERSLGQLSRPVARCRIGS
jgi:hypothetical protein